MTQEISEVVRERLEALRMTTRELERAANLPTNYIGQLLDGKKGSVKHDTLVSIASALGLTVDELLGNQAGTEDPYCAFKIFTLSPEQKAALPLLAPGGQDLAVFQCDREIRQVSIEPGDWLIVDTANLGAAGGHILCAPNGETEVRRFALATRHGDFATLLRGAGRPFLIGDDARWRIVGELRAVWRALQTR